MLAVEEYFISKIKAKLCMIRVMASNTLKLDFTEIYYKESKKMKPQIGSIFNMCTITEFI